MSKPISKQESEDEAGKVRSCRADHDIMMICEGLLSLTPAPSFSPSPSTYMTDQVSTTDDTPLKLHQDR